MGAPISASNTPGMRGSHEAGLDVAGVGRSSTANTTARTSSSCGLYTKFSYTLDAFKNIQLELNAGVQNIFNSYQKDFDTGAGRASSYVYGPGAPRSFFAGFKMNI